MKIYNQYFFDDKLTVLVCEYFSDERLYNELLIDNRLLIRDDYYFCDDIVEIEPQAKYRNIYIDSSVLDEKPIKEVRFLFVIDDSRMPSPEEVASWPENTKEEKERLQKAMKELTRKLKQMGL